MAFFDLSAAHAEIADDLDEAYRRVMRAGRFILGGEVEAFESEFAAYCGVRHCIGVGNGLDALHLILRAAGIGPGDEVIVPSNTFIATWLAVSYCGATPVPVEPDIATCNIDPGLIEAALTPRTRAIIAVHLYGRLADIAAIRDIAKRHSLRLFEDAAQAHGARCDGRLAGALGDAAAFSFYPTKNLGCLGDGGAVTTNDDALAAQVRLLGNYGSPAKYQHVQKGFNSRLDELQAAFLRVKLKHLDAWNARRIAIGHRYDAQLRHCPDLTLPSDLGPAHVQHQYVLRHPHRDMLQAHMEGRGIGTMIHYPVAPHLSAAYAGSTSSEPKARDPYPIATRLAGDVLSLPMAPHMTSSAVDEVIEGVLGFAGHGDGGTPAKVLAAVDGR
ncbi:MAG TPA: DegT/DnrJ/EryC1/StrS family aminotransferase [Stellaceae bacterium]|nr:DegT/DnrJ/EryC1/StrS family aminotransferase [Stellaceae bacterium]